MSAHVDAYSRVTGRETVPCRYVDRLLIALWPWTMDGRGAAPGADLRAILDKAEPLALARCADDPMATIERAARGVDYVVREMAPPIIAALRYPGLDHPSRIATLLRDAPPITPSNVAAVHSDLSERTARFPMHCGGEHDALRALGWLRKAASSDSREEWAAAIELCARSCASPAITHAGWGRTYVATWRPAALLLRAILGVSREPMALEPNALPSPAEAAPAAAERGR